jgi:alpha-glucuronidase
MRSQWQQLEDADLVDRNLHTRVADRLTEQARCADEWRDQINTYFLRKSGIGDAHGRVIH